MDSHVATRMQVKTSHSGDRIKVVPCTYQYIQLMLDSSTPLIVLESQRSNLSQRRYSSSKMSWCRFGRACDMSQHVCGQTSLIAEVYRKWSGRAEICQGKKTDDNFSSFSMITSCNTDPLIGGEILQFPALLSYR